MQNTTESTQCVPAMTYTLMLEKVRYDGAYPTRERAEEAVRLVLDGLGGQLAGDERASLAARLPQEAAAVLLAARPETPLSGRDFVNSLALSTGSGVATTRWDVGSVLTTVAQLTGPDLLARILRALPQGYALLFGRAELARAA
ncbi:DUF2267 domain-containing protein [Streptomyces sp. NBC_01218]|uniref:DUF2267 domain-containing protein n=1 Tax=unclassified Streptomyces TaxID=2593676 RepID=UPI0023B9B576|nr:MULTISPECIES: DUF2267 domain-containing protein [unclassified Streptomyces]WEH38975.1 DUF2267 domain-containing protein [Streptomyces sp. AM 2-1-1]WSQ50635.1 DUF2267 domain-containing protein [Streptomyces sp. NBC_01218]